MPTDAWRVAQTVGRITPSSMLGDVDPDTIEDTCPGCGRYMELNKSGLCGTSECREGRLKRAIDQDIVFKANSTYIFDRDRVAVFKTPPPSEKTQKILRECGDLQEPLPVCIQCGSIPRPDDSLCVRHRLEENARIHAKEKRIQAKTNVGTADELPSRRKTKHRKIRNKIKGFDRLR